MMDITIKKSYIKNNIHYTPAIFGNNKFLVTIEYFNIIPKTRINQGLLTLFILIAYVNNLKINIEDQLNEKIFENLQKLPNLILNSDKELIDKGHLKVRDYIDINLLNGTKKDILDNTQKNRCVSTSTGGVDSTSTIIKYKEKITDLLYVYGFDVNEKLSSQEWINKILANQKIIINKIFGEQKVNNVLCRTNLWNIIVYEIDRRLKLKVRWAEYTNGAGIASIIYPINHAINNLIISGPGVGNIYRKYMQHVHLRDVDELLSCNELSIFHDDNMARYEKIKFIYEKYPNVLQNLRFCINWGSTTSLNCLKCDKCIRTCLMIYLTINPYPDNFLQMDDEKCKEYIKYFKDKYDRDNGHIDLDCNCLQIDDLVKENNKKSQLSIISN